ncbi:hypothetical protein J6590_055229 [Homalodisca vitripennis]|nr:hypothetical protein J6590_055229 [Homalodisca vitripennis]
MGPTVPETGNDPKEEHQNPSVRVCDVTKPSEGGSCGFHLTRTKWDPYPWVCGVDENSPASTAGLQKKYSRGNRLDAFVLRKTIKFPNFLLASPVTSETPAITRSRYLQTHRHPSTTFDSNSPVARFVRRGNRVASEYYLFCDSVLLA